MIRLVIMDQGGLLTRNFDIIPEAARRLGLEAPTLRLALAPDMPAFMRGELSENEVWRRFEDRTGLVAKEHYFETLFSPIKDEPTEALILGLRGRGFRVVAGTNTIDSHYRILGDLGHFAAYDAVYASQLMGLCKPDAAFWEAILEAEGVQPEEAFFADDMAENVEAAEALGMHARLYTDAAALEAELSPLLKAEEETWEGEPA